MKWVKVRHGTYKCVADDDERPAVNLPNKPLGSFFTPFKPSWGKYEEGMKHPDVPSREQAKYADKFLSEREHALRTDARAKRWELGRKAAWQKDKPQWVKKMHKEGEL